MTRGEYKEIYWRWKSNSSRKIWKRSMPQYRNDNINLTAHSNFNGIQKRKSLIGVINSLMTAGKVH
jgi:hypothetical protein